MRTLSVFVTGIAAFVEDCRRVLAVNVPQPVSVKFRDGRRHSDYTTIPAHFPYLRMPLEHIDLDTQARLKIVHDWDVSVAPGVFPLNNAQNPLIRQTLVKFLHFQEVKLPASDTPPTVDETALNATGIPIPTDEKSLRWLTSMANLGTAATRIDPKHVVDNPTDVAAYVRFPNGEISTAFATQFKFEAVTALDNKRAGVLNQAAAQLVVCKMAVPDVAFEVECRGYHGGDDFKIKFNEGIPDPWMVFACSSLEDVFQLPSVPEEFGVDLHFRLVYGLAEGPVSDADVALPKSINPAPGSGKGKTLGAPRCIPPRFVGGSTGGIN